MSSKSSEKDNEPGQPLRCVAKKSTCSTNTNSGPSISQHEKTPTVAETSIPKKRKWNRKSDLPSNTRRSPGALYDENGIHITTSRDLCDCLVEDCVGCFFPCPKCGSQKCGIDCRVNRKFVYEEIEYEGYGTVVKNPLHKN